MSRSLAVLFALIGFCLTLTGCGGGGPQLGTVSGTVTMDGQPLANVGVAFTPVDGGRPATGVTDQSGKYQLVFAGRKGAPVGKHKVSLTMSPAPSTSGSSGGGEVAPGGSGASPEDYAAQSRAMAKTKMTIPERYNTKSELVEEVTAGNNVIDFKLTSGAAADSPEQ